MQPLRGSRRMQQRARPVACTLVGGVREASAKRGGCARTSFVLVLACERVLWVLVLVLARCKGPTPTTPRAPQHPHVPRAHATTGTLSCEHKKTPLETTRAPEGAPALRLSTWLDANLSDLMGSTSRRAAFVQRPHQGGSWPSTTGFTSSSSLWHLRAGARQGEFEAPSKPPEENLLHPTPPAPVPVPVLFTLPPFES